MADIIYPAGVKFFKKNDKQPEWIIGAFVITPDDLNAFIIDHPELMTEYNGKKQLKCQLRKGKDGPYIAVDTWKAEPKGSNEAPTHTANDGPGVAPELPADDLPF